MMKKNFGIIVAISIIFFGSIILLFLKNTDRSAEMPSSDLSINGSVTTDEQPLPIPPLLQDRNPLPHQAEFHLTAQASTMEFIKGIKTQTLGYNGNYLGPVIRVKKGDDVTIKVKNGLNEQTTIHWHGLEVSGDKDGGPHSPINPGDSWSVRFTINQPAATLWYHPHLLHKTGEQVYKGLAGLFLIDDEVTENLSIPKEYGVDDIPLVIQDKKLAADGNISYDLGMRDVMMGLQGNTVLVNGAVNPFLEVPHGKVRLRLLNASNARIYEFRLNNDQDFWQIGTDGGLLESPVKMNKLVLGPAERAEIMIDFAKFKKNDVVFLQDRSTKLMKFIVNNTEKKNNDQLPEKLAVIPKIDPETAIKTREFVFQGMGPMVNINGKQIDLARIDEVVHRNSTEIWEISNESMGMMNMMGGGMAHPFHAHGVQFQILERNGNPPPANETGWKDTILVYPGEKVKAIATFKYPGLFMYHCHILEHEDAGMMGQFRVDEGY